MQIPVTLRDIEKIHDGDGYFVSDLATGDILEVGQVLWEVIEDCGRLTMGELLREYASRIPPQSLYVAVEALAGYAEAGLLVAGPGPSGDLATPDRPRALVLHDLLGFTRPEDAGAVARVVHRLASLVPQAAGLNLVVPIPAGHSEHFGSVLDALTVVEWDPAQPFIAFRRCDGLYDVILDLGASPALTLPLFEEGEAPIMAIHQGVAPPSQQDALAKASVLRSYDTLILEDSVQVGTVLEQLPVPVSCFAMPSHVSTPEDPDEVRRQSRQWLHDHTTLAHPPSGLRVAVYVDGARPSTVREIAAVAEDHTEVSFVLLGAVAPERGATTPPNLLCVAADAVATSAAWWQCMDLVITFGGWGISWPLIRIAMAVGTPILPLGAVPQELSSCAPEAAESLGAAGDGGPASALGAAIPDLMNNRQTWTDRGEAAREQALRLSSTPTGDSLRQVADRSLRGCLDRRSPWEADILFTRVYDPTDGRVRTEAVCRDNGVRMTAAEGIMESLASECSPVELAILRRWLDSEANEETSNGRA